MHYLGNLLIIVLLVSCGKKNESPPKPPETLDPQQQEQQRERPNQQQSKHPNQQQSKHPNQQQSKHPDQQQDTDKQKNTPTIKLFRGANLGKLELVQEALNEGADVNAVGTSGSTALIFAVQGNHVDVVEFLLKQDGIDVNFKDKNGRTAYEIAVEKYARSAAVGQDIYLMLEPVTQK